MTPTASWLLVAIFVGLPTLIFYCALVAAKRADERLRKPLHRHTCSICARVQQWEMPHDQWSPCRACQTRSTNARVEIDLDDFATAKDLAVYLDGADALKPLNQSQRDATAA